MRAGGQLKPSQKFLAKSSQGGTFNLYPEKANKNKNFFSSGAGINQKNIVE
jgi:hypothetical protein